MVEFQLRGWNRVYAKASSRDNMLGLMWLRVASPCRIFGIALMAHDAGSASLLEEHRGIWVSVDSCDLARIEGKI